jgi:hypothetical protein
MFNHTEGSSYNLNNIDEKQNEFDDELDIGNAMFSGGNLPRGVGKNGIVFETSRPDDPENFQLRF